jgi:hypothetical protein
VEIYSNRGPQMRSRSKTILHFAWITKFRSSSRRVEGKLNKMAFITVMGASISSLTFVLNLVCMELLKGFLFYLRKIEKAPRVISLKISIQVDKFYKPSKLQTYF